MLIDTRLGLPAIRAGASDARGRAAADGVGEVTLGGLRAAAAGVSLGAAAPEGFVEVEAATAGLAAAGFTLEALDAPPGFTDEAGAIEARLDAVAPAVDVPAVDLSAGTLLAPTTDEAADAASLPSLVADKPALAVDALAAVVSPGFDVAFVAAAGFVAGAVPDGPGLRTYSYHKHVILLNFPK